jgi:hypothetical protein
VSIDLDKLVDSAPEAKRVETRFSEVTATLSARGVPTYWVRASHDGLHKHVVIRAGDTEVLQQRCLVQAENWNALWAKRSAADLKIQRTLEKKEARRLHIESQKELHRNEPPRPSSFWTRCRIY